MSVSLVIPCRNAAASLGSCLASVSRMADDGVLQEILLIDDGSTDETAAIAAQFPVHVISADGLGAAAARNLGWRAAGSLFVWFLDADCVAQPDTLRHLLPHMNDPSVAGAGGSYINMTPNSLLARLIHYEIVERHKRMPTDASFLASYNVLYRRRVLEELGGFDPDCFWAHDAELAYRVHRAGYGLRFERQSKVGHFHPERLHRYLEKQTLQGYWRIMLYRRHPRRITGDSYSGWTDFLQPPLAMGLLALFPLLFMTRLAWLPLAAATALLAAQLPMAWRIARSEGLSLGVAFILLGFVRAFARGLGMTKAFWDLLREGLTSRSSPARRVPRRCEFRRQSLGQLSSSRSSDRTSRVSVVIPTRNRAESLGDCLDSLARQTEPVLEVIVVDDASKDGTAETVRRFATGHPRMHVVLLQNRSQRGANASRNRGIAAAQCELVAFTDDDCLLDPCWIEGLMEAFDGPDVAAVTGVVENVAPANLFELTLKGMHLVAGGRKATRLVGGSMCVRREPLLTYMFDDDRRDLDLQTTDEHPKSVASERCDEEGLFLKLREAGAEMRVAPRARAVHMHRHSGRSFFALAYRGGQSAARLVYKYYLSPRLDLLPFLLAYLVMPLALWRRETLWVAASLFCLGLAAIVYNDLVRKQKTILETIVTLPLLIAYYQVRLLGYVLESLRLRLTPHRLKRERLPCASRPA
jgi:glycosyltransferase involved in cell wall biosynthesis